MTGVIWPAVKPRVTEEAGTRNGTHTGIDLAAERGDPVLAPFDGTVVFVGGDGASGRLWLGDRWLYPNGQGRTVEIQRADGLISRVGHLEGYNVRVGDKVRAGDVTGYAGDSGYSTGVHIHWELRWDRAWNGGRWINPRSVAPTTFTAQQSLTTIHEEEDMLINLRGKTGSHKAGLYLFKGGKATYRGKKQSGFPTLSDLTIIAGLFKEYKLS
ncbi:M23 family metallopeptidase [Leucobacter chromiiresistens]|uniref:Peptidase family M23 n=1 Tax=Leucobacter chromiiresistens TaxID=1079994 RepID=A0A1H0XQX0_9MICO|nr:M23 family metallopeptidase [Leucobacter chromiiresistens]SDQ04843.1 Peptidase family M23 [Leucobacter chromiiresistens]SDQ05300.1 Peptidase family M23 [Leucobacter chromiiresistens]